MLHVVHENGRHTVVVGGHEDPGAGSPPGNVLFELGPYLVEPPMLSDVEVRQKSPAFMPDEHDEDDDLSLIHI